MKTALTRERRLHLLERVPALAGLPHAERARLACVLDETCVGPGQVVVAEGDEADRLYLVAEGRLEVSLTGPCGPMRVAILDTGEIFGEVALLTPGARCTATVRALTNGRLLSLPAPMYQTLLHAHPGPRAAFAGRAELVAMANFLKQASPFAALPPGALQALARRMERISVGEGATILRQGEVSDGCYVLRRGRLEVLAREGSGEQRQLAFLGPGTLVGETALLTAAPCNATVRALEPGDLLLLRRGDLLAAMRADRAVGGEILRLLQLRARPRRQSGAEAHQRVDATGALHTVLKDPVRGAHFRLTPEGWFLWQLLDGRHTMRDLVMDYLARFAMFAPQAIADFLAGLAAAGFLEGPALHEDAARAAQRLAP